MTLLGRWSPKRLPAAAAGVGGGLVVGGVTAYAFLVLSARAVGATGYAPLSALWALVLVLGSGAFMPLEQEVARATAARVVVGEGVGPVVRRALGVGGVLAGAVGIALLAGAPYLADKVFDGQVVFTTALALAMVGYLGQFVTRGVLAGLGRYFEYGRLLGVEGILRLLGCVALVVAHVGSPAPYGVVVALAPLIALGAVPALRGIAREPGPPSPAKEVTTAFAYLLAASLLSQVLVNAGPAAVQWIATPAEREAAGRFLAALIVSRLPLFFYGAVQASVLPRLAGFAAESRRADFSRLFQRALVAVVAVGVAATAASYLVGATVLGVVFGEEYRVRDIDMAVLAATTTGVMVAMTVAQGLIAVQRYARVSVGWLAGAVVFAAVLIVDGPAVVRVERSLLAGSTAASALLALFAWSSLRRTWSEGGPVVPSAVVLES